MKKLLLKSKWLLCAITGLSCATAASAQLRQSNHDIFHQSTSNTQGYFAANFNTLTHSDLNGDGTTDMIITGSAGLHLFLFDQAGKFRVQHVDTYPFQPPGYGACVAADLNDDGQLDFAWYDWQVNDIIVSYWNSTNASGDPVYTGPQQLNTTGLSSDQGVYGMNAADIDNDGDTDLLAFGPNGTQRPHMILNDGGGNFIRYDLHDLPFYQSFSRVTDLNNDGLPDILVNTGGTIDLYTNTGNAGFPSIPVFTHSILIDGSVIPGFDSNSGWFDLADFDQDGKTDILVSYKEYRHSETTFYGRTTLFVNRTTSAPAYNFVASNLFELHQPYYTEERMGGFGARYIDVDNNGTLDIIGNRGGSNGDAFDKVSAIKLAIDGAGHAVGTETTLLEYNAGDVNNYQGMNLIYDDIDGDNKRDYLYAYVHGKIISRNSKFPVRKSPDLLISLDNSVFIGGDRNEDVELTITVSDAAAALYFMGAPPAQVSGAGSSLVTITGKLSEVNTLLTYATIEFSQVGNFNINYSVKNLTTQELYTNSQPIVLAPLTYYPKPGMEMSLEDVNSWSDSPDGLGVTPAGFNGGYEFVLSNSTGTTEFGAGNFPWAASNFTIPQNTVFNLNGSLATYGKVNVKGEIKGTGGLMLYGSHDVNLHGNITLDQVETSGHVSLKGKLKVQHYLFVGAGVLSIDSGSIELNGDWNSSGMGQVDASAGEVRIQYPWIHINGSQFTGRIQKLTLNYPQINFMNGSFDLDTLNIEHGKLSISYGQLSADVIIGGDANSYILADNATLKTTIRNGQSGRFPIGADYYNPVTITNNSGTDDDFAAASTFDWGQQEYATLDPASRVYNVWEITKANPNSGAGVDITLGWNSGQEFQMGLAGLYHFENGAWVEVTDGAITRAPQQLTFTGYKGTFSPFAVMSSFAMLPVTWKSFEAKAANKSVVLDWNTGFEGNIRNFEIQKSSDGINWSKIGSVVANNLNTGSSYHFVDEQPFSGANFYRIKQVDRDGKTGLSKTVKVIFAGSEVVTGFRAYPNPVENGILKVELRKESIVTVYNSAGVQVYQKRLATGSQQIRLANLPKGVYTLKINQEAQRIVLQ